ncbi:uncharacterized protein LOC120327124 [Styela clava]
MMALGDIRIFNEEHIENRRNFIGNGGMGIVGLGRWKISDKNDGIQSGYPVAIKRLEIASGIDTIKQEAKMLWKLHEDCNYVLKMYGLMQSEFGICLVLEYMKFGNISDFFSYVQTGCGRNDTATRENLWPLKLRIVEQVSRGMEFLHSRKIIHCDLKAANVLLNQDVDVKICDFGLAKMKLLTTRPSSNPEGRKGGKLNNNPAGTVSHVAPELLEVNKSPTRSSDVYSFGVFIWEILTDKIPYSGVRSGDVIINDVQKGKRPDLSLVPSDSPDILVSTMKLAWQQDANIRPKFSDIYRLFQDFNANIARQIEDSKEFAIQAWHKGKFPSETVPKQIDSRPSNLRTNSEPFSSAVPYRILQQQQPILPQASPLLTSLRADELCISSGFDSHQRTDSTTSLLNEEHHTDYAKRCASPDVDLPQPEIHRGRCSCMKSPPFTHIFIGIIFASATFTIMHFVQPNQFERGCCLNCFNSPNSKLRSNCSSVKLKGDIAPPDTFCTFNCSDGAVLNVNSTALRCNKDGIWSGPLPFCRKIRQCSTLTPPANGGSVQCTNGNYENSKCTFECPEGFKMKFTGTDQSPTVTCQVDSISNFYWSGQEPYCEKVVQCGQPTTDGDVVVTCNTPKTSLYYRDTNKWQDTTYPNGTTCKFSCENAMSLDANETYGLCQDNGDWNMTSEIKCIEGCPHFADPPKSTHTCTIGRLENSRCTFKCDDNFTMVGSNNMVCHSGRWINPPPRCQCPSCRSGKNCENTVNFTESWQQMNATMKVVYDGHLIICADMDKVFTKKKKRSNTMYGCQCRDRVSNTNKQCNDPESPSQACKKAFATLILIMSFNETLTLPCDAESMPLACKYK